MSKYIFTLILVLTLYSSAFAADTNTTWDTFKNNNSIIGFTLGESTIKDIVGKMGGELPEKPDDKHELSTLCFKVYEQPIYIVFSTGVLHDYSTLYGFQMSKDITDNLKNSCTQYKLAENQDITTNGGLHIGQSKDNVLNIQNKPSKKTSQNWEWDYENYLNYATPKITSSEAGPTDSKYLMKIISKGAYEDGSISVKFSSDKVVEYSVSYYAESDFHIEHYDIQTGARIR